MGSRNSGRGASAAVQTDLRLNVDQKVFDRWLDACLEHLDLQAHRNKKIQHLSGGQQRRAYLARAILVLLVSPHPEKVLILDEFTSGLDMIVQYRILSWLRDLSAEEHRPNSGDCYFSRSDRRELPM